MKNVEHNLSHTTDPHNLASPRNGFCSGLLHGRLCRKNKCCKALPFATSIGPARVGDPFSVPWYCSRRSAAVIAGEEEGSGSTAAAIIPCSRLSSPIGTVSCTSVTPVAPAQVCFVKPNHAEKPCVGTIQQVLNRTVLRLPLVLEQEL